MPSPSGTSHHLDGDDYLSADAPSQTTVPNSKARGSVNAHAAAAVQYSGARAPRGLPSVSMVPPSPVRIGEVDEGGEGDEEAVSVESLYGMGFAESIVEIALADCRGDTTAALERLLSLSERLSENERSRQSSPGHPYESERAENDAVNAYGDDSDINEADAHVATDDDANANDASANDATDTAANSTDTAAAYADADASTNTDAATAAATNATPAILNNADTASAGVAVAVDEGEVATEDTACDAPDPCPEAAASASTVPSSTAASSSAAPSAAASSTVPSSTVSSSTTASSAATSPPPRLGEHWCSLARAAGATLRAAARSGRPAAQGRR